MSTHKYMDCICVATVVLSLLLTILFVNGETLDLQATGKTIGYEDRLFDTSRVHTLDIVMDDWEGFLETCQSEEYSVCSVVIDGESFKNVGIRGKGNTSLSSVSAMGSSRYSFKIEFDQYDSTKSYHGLDKLSLNNLIQDNTMMKDYLTYQMMNAFGVSSSLCSFVYITVNGGDWGLYLAVEGVEEAFLQRNYGSDYGELYKPDSMSFGGGRGNGRDFDINDFAGSSDDEGGDTSGQAGQMPDFGNFTPPNMPGNFQNGDSSGQGNGMPDLDSLSPPSIPGNSQGSAGDSSSSGQDGGRQPILPDRADPRDFDPSSLFGGGGLRFGGSSDVKLQYIDDNPESYPNIFDNAKTDISKADKTRLISSLQSLSSYEDLENVLDMDEVLRYFVVHNFVVNGDSYTGNMIHNYYLYEENGRLSMIPWDYNLAFGTFMGSAATSSVNDPIDDALSDRPMQAWIFSNEAYTQRYHEMYGEFLNTVDAAQIIDDAYALIAGYVEKDPTRFCTYEAFETGVQTLKSFCSLRKESVEGQLEGTIPSSSQEQSANSEALIQADDLSLSDMGTMNNGGGPGDNGGRGMPGGKFQRQNLFGAETSKDSTENNSPEAPPEGETPGGRGNAPSTEQEEGGEAPEEPGAGAMEPPAGNGGFRGESPWGGDAMPLGETGSDMETWLLLGGSALLLLLGLAFAKFYK